MSTQKNDQKHWFAYDPEEGLEFFTTEEQALSAGNKMVRDWLSDGGWGEEVAQVCVGKMTHEMQQTNKVNRPDDLDEDGFDSEGTCWDPDWDYMCDYELMPTQPEESDTSTKQDSVLEAHIIRALDALKFTDQISSEWDADKQVRLLREQVQLARKLLTIDTGATHEN